ncbi:S8 family serine peptidase [Kangiella shandongensis]|uniref:S8 family serine peptidase n=1 Tax=Kangiella shandongensis TaxID=2763258 RepID=UPI001CBB803E|nr:S8 family serine peptidase [Kangiella shandongensis]
MKKSIIALAVGMSIAAGVKAQPTSDQIIIKYKEGVDIEAKASSRAMLNMSARAAEQLQHRKFTFNKGQVIRLSKKQSHQQLNQLIKRLNSDPDIEFAEIDVMVKPSATANDEHYPLQWHYHDAVAGINLEAAWDSSTGAGTTVAVLDTGYRPHVDLAANITGGYDMIEDTFVANDGDGRDSDASDPGDWYEAFECGFNFTGRDSSWHGTHVAGTVAALTNNSIGVAGIAHDAQVVPVRVLGKCGGYTSDIADGIVWASGGSVSGTPANANPAQVLNLSLGGSGECGSVTQDAVNTARANGAVVVVAAGNSNSDVSGFTPANCNGVISVAATNKQADRASYSNYGSLIDIAAPGGESGSDGVASTLNDGATTPGNDIYAYYAGTSMASPHVAGVAALMFAANGGLTPDEVEQAIKDSAKAFPGGSSCSTSNCGAGMLDAAAAVAAVGGSEPPQNEAPTAAFTYSCTDLSCDFDGSASADSDGSIVSYNWSFGASGVNVSHTFASAGTYSVTLTVTDDDGATGTATQDVTVTDSSGGDINLSANGYKVKGRHTIDLAWSGATSTNVDIYRDGQLIATVANSGGYTDSTNNRGQGSYSYQVCEEGNSTCSGEVTVTF